jgi:hypothetical protein
MADETFSITFGEELLAEIDDYLTPRQGEKRTPEFIRKLRTVDEWSKVRTDST